jgi:hypothetical protein
MIYQINIYKKRNICVIPITLLDAFVGARLACEADDAQCQAKPESQLRGHASLQPGIAQKYSEATYRTTCT